MAFTAVRDTNKVVEEIFGDSIHREVVGRSAKLLRFLSSMEDALTTEHLDLIWSSCVGKAEPELQVRQWNRGGAGWGVRKAGSELQVRQLDRGWGKGGHSLRVVLRFYDEVILCQSSSVMCVFKRVFFAECRRKSNPIRGLMWQPRLLRLRLLSFFPITCKNSKNIDNSSSSSQSVIVRTTVLHFFVSLFFVFLLLVQTSLRPFFSFLFVCLFVCCWCCCAAPVSLCSLMRVRVRVRFARVGARALQAVVYQLLTTLVECMKPELVVHLIGRLQESADGLGRAGGRSEVLSFVECLAANQGHVILTRWVGWEAARGRPIRGGRGGGRGGGHGHGHARGPSLDSRP